MKFFSFASCAIFISTSLVLAQEQSTIDGQKFLKSINNATGVKSIKSIENNVTGQKFLKRIENNYTDGTQRISSDGDTIRHYNTGSKTDIEKLFFGDKNADVEFFYSSSSDGIKGFRIFRNPSIGAYVIEIKRISNWKEVEYGMMKKMSNKNKGLSAKQISRMNEEEREQFLVNIRDSLEKIKKESLVLYDIETKSIAITDSLAKKLYNKVISIIDKYHCNGFPSMVFDGYTVAFRSVVDYELWTLTVQMPQGDVRKLTETFLGIITDVTAGEFNEYNYLKSLDN